MSHNAMKVKRTKGQILAIEGACSWSIMYKHIGHGDGFIAWASSGTGSLILINDGSRKVDIKIYRNILSPNLQKNVSKATEGKKKPKTNSNWQKLWYMPGKALPMRNATVRWCQWVAVISFNDFMAICSSIFAHVKTGCSATDGAMFRVVPQIYINVNIRE